MFFPRCGIHHYSLNFVQSHYYWDNIWQHRIIPCWYFGTSQTLALQSHAFPSLFSSEVTWNQCQSHRPGPEQTENITFRVHVHSISMFQCCVHSVIYGTHHISQCCQKTYLWSWSLIYTVAGDPLGSLHICDHEDISLIYIYMMIHWETSMIMITYMVSQCLHMEVSPNRATMYYPTSKAWMIRGTRSSDNSHWVTSTCGEKSEKSTAGSVLAVFFCHFLNQQPWLMVDDECSTMVVDDI